MFNSIDKVELLNGIMAFVAFMLNSRAYSRLRIISSKKYQIFASVLGIILLWYALVNFAIAFGILVPHIQDLIKFYRFGFWVLVGATGLSLHYAADLKVQ